MCTPLCVLHLSKAYMSVKIAHSTQECKPWKIGITEVDNMIISSMTRGHADGLSIGIRCTFGD